MSRKRYPDVFKTEAIREILDRDCSVAEVASRQGVSMHSMYEWLKKFGPGECWTEVLEATQQELRRVKAELRRVIEQRDILNSGAHISITFHN